MSGVARRDELAAALAATEARIAAAARDAGREPGELTLVAVSKTWPASDVLLLASLGLRDFGENRAQEAVHKAAAVAAAGLDVRWHFVGRLQRNKCRAVAGFAVLVHSVDRAELVAGLAAGGVSAGRVLDVLLQVSLDADPGRGGALPAEIPRLADAVGAASSLRLRGVMAVAPLGVPPRPAFARLRATAETLRRDHPEAEIISAGMSEDFADAVAEGATHLRIGSSLFGKRPAVP
ncbi:MAG: YggS family pyridoxal phosphate-dependent enzyme [Frankiaceae bacterium]